MTFFEGIWFWLQEVGLAGFLDIALISLLIYSVLIFLKKTQRAAFVVTGILILGGVYFAAVKGGLAVTAWLLQGFFAVLVITLVVIFQEELRHFFEQLALRSLPKSLQGKKPKPQMQRKEVEILTRSLSDLAQAKIGALVVIRGKNLLLRHLEGGEDVEAKISEPLLKSIFDPHSMGHDGAVIIEGDRIDKLGVHLPLSKNFEELRGRGTRHTAALGLSELSDALCLIVSEERGTISVARRGRMRVIADTTELERLIAQFYEEITPPPKANPFLGFFKENYREKSLAILIACAMWWALGYRPAQAAREFSVPVVLRQVDPDLRAAEIVPDKVRVTLFGTRLFLRLLSADDLTLELDVGGYEAGIQEVPIESEALRVPGNLEIREISPQTVNVRLERITKPPVSP